MTDAGPHAAAGGCRRRGSVVAAAAGVATAAGVLRVPQMASTYPGERSDADELPRPPRSALAIPEPRPLRAPRSGARWAPVITSTAARAAPSAAAPVVARLSTRTPEATAHVVLALGSVRDSAGRAWVRVGLPVLPNGTTGWVPRRALGGYTFVRTRLEIDTSRLTATLRRQGRAVFRARVAVGRASAPTPRGRFHVRNRLVSFASAFYGPLAFGTSARSATLTDWPGGGFVGIHGTNRPELIPGRVSHGCVRMRNADILRLDRLMPIGTPLEIS